MRKEIVDGEEKDVWGFKEKEWAEKEKAYLSVNASSLDKQKGLDLKEWVDKGWIAYYDFDDTEPDRMGSPHAGDMY